MYVILLNNLIVNGDKGLWGVFELDKSRKTNLQLIRFRGGTFSKNEKVFYSHHAYDSAKLLGCSMDKDFGDGVQA